MYGMNEELKIQTPNMALFEKIDKHLSMVPNLV